jgi:hypothetical protein
MFAFAESFDKPLPKILTQVFTSGEEFDTYEIPAGAKLFKSYRKQLYKWTLDQVFPVNGPAYFGFDEPNVSVNYGFAFAYKTTAPYKLLAIDSKKTLQFLWRLSEGREAVQKTLRVCFGYDPNNLEKSQIRTSDEILDNVLVDFLCENGFQGYAGDYIATLGGGRFHPECVICGGRINVELNREYGVDGRPGLASPTEKHRAIESMLTDRHMRTLIPDRKRKSNMEIYEESNKKTKEESNKKKKEETETKTETEEHFTNLFGYFDGGARRKKRTQKRHRQKRNKQTRSQKKNKSRK